ncbi:PorV/PorQ family protein [candidate division WOR-3 bacterium]|nr:PorV/PorQ family protein [candidate division WOR-3 bacterium]
MKRLLAMVGLVVLLTGSLDARLGRSGAAFLTLGGGTRPMALGGAYTAFAEGIETIYWNPAGIATTDRMGFSVTHSRLFAGMSQECLSLVIPVPDGGLGISVVALRSGEMEVTRFDEWDTGETFSWGSYSVGISYARMMTVKFNAGVTIKAIYESVHQVSSMGMAVDAGGTYNTGVRNLRFGFLIQHFGPDQSLAGEGLFFEEEPEGFDEDRRYGEDLPATFRSEAYVLPMTFRGGAAIDLIQSPISRATLMAELIHPSDQSTTFGVGLEYAIGERYFLRVGYTGLNMRGLTAGLGALLDVGGVPMSVGYTFETHRYLSAIHRFSVGYGGH